MRSKTLRRTLHAALLSGVAACAGLSGCGPYRGGATAIMTWSIVDPREPDPLTAPQLTCEQKSVATVRILLSSGKIFDFPCSAYTAETEAVPSDTYTITVMAIGYNSAILSQQSFTTRLLGRTDLGHIIFQTF